MSRTLMEWFQAKILNGVNFIDWEISVAGIKRHRRDLYGDGVRNLTTKSERTAKLRNDILMRRISLRSMDSFQGLTPNGSWRFNMDIWHGFMKEIHQFLFDHAHDIVCMKCGKDMVPDLRAKGIHMNEEKFGTFEAMDGYASGPDVEGKKSHLLEDKQIPSVWVFDEMSFYTPFQGIHMNEEKFGTFEAMDGYASGPDVEGSRGKECGCVSTNIMIFNLYILVCFVDDKHVTCNT
nr:FCP1-like domain, HAD-like domain protein [Tanacetum cinerariifolium]